MPSRDSALALLQQYGQQHLLRFWAELDDSARHNLLTEIASVDFDLISRLHRETADSRASVTPVAKEITPLRGRAWASLAIPERATLSNVGMRLLRQGKVAAFLMAGGLGTRLGHDGPKGTLDIGLPSGKSLFQIQAERLLKLGRLCGKPVPWYIMTSRENHAQTEGFFAEKGFFGLDARDVRFFMQGEMPAIDDAGKILLAAKNALALSPNGNGGCFRALRESGALEEMRRLGVEWIFAYSVDNALIRICDPRFLGFAENSGQPMAGKAVAKSSPAEKVGVFCLRGGRPAVLEYSEMSPSMAEARSTGGALSYGSANIAAHLFRRDFLESHAAADLPWHLARKRIPHLAPDGNPVKPDSPNACKFEMFLFDLFPKAEGLAVLEVERNEEFAPVKNAVGVDSPATARRLILDAHRRWALEVGWTTAELEGLEVEVSPLTSYAGEGLERGAFRRDPDRPLLLA